MYLASFIDRDNSMVPLFGVFGAAQWREAPLRRIPVKPCYRDSSRGEQHFQVHHNLMVNFIKIKIYFKNLILQLKSVSKLCGESE